MMKNSNIIQVFKFSLIQNMKNKTFIILTILCAVLMLLLTPTMIYVSSGIVHSDKTSIKKVYILDNELICKENIIETNGIKLEKEYIEKKLDKKDVCEGFKSSKFYMVNETFDSYKSKFEKLKDVKNCLLVRVEKNDVAYQLKIYKSDDSIISDTDMTTFTGELVKLCNQLKISNLKFSEESKALLSTDIVTSVEKVGESISDKASEMSVVMIVLMVVILFISLSGENISTQIVTEKSTKLVEYLLVHIKPLELVVGKILASVILSLMQLGVMIGSGLLSIVVSKELGIITSYDETLEFLKIKSIVNTISGVDIVMIVFFLVAGFIFYAIIAAMLASTVSRLEELSGINMIYSVILIIAVYSYVFVLSFTEGSKMIDMIMVCLPFTAVFIAPAYIMLGKVSLSVCVISAIVHIIIVSVLALIAAKIYVSLILYTGKKMSIKQLWSVVFRKKEGDVGA